MHETSDGKTILGSLRGYTLRSRFACKTQVGMIMIPDIGEDGRILPHGLLIAGEPELKEADPDFWMIYMPDEYWHGHLKPGFRVVRADDGGSRLEKIGDAN